MVGGPVQGGGVGGAEGAAGGPDALHVLDQAAVRRWAVVIRSAFASQREEIDALNVFPVPDGDTGTNLYLTFDGAVDRIRALDEATGAGELLTAFAEGLLWTARGNSGVILSQLVRGFAEGCAGAEIIDVPVLVQALARADERAWQGVTDPKEGTILSVSRAAAEAAAAHADEDLYAVSAAVRDAARIALERTPSQLPVLARAGVVDAGGAGFVIILESLERVCAGDDAKVLLGLGAPDRRSRLWTGEPGVGGVAGIAGGASGGVRAERAGEAVRGGPVGGGAVDPEVRAADEPREGPDHAATDFCATSVLGAGVDQESDTPEFEVMYLLADATEDRVATLRARLVELGHSVLVVGGEGLWNIHAHVDDAGAAVEAGITAGRPHRIRITTLLSAEAEAMRHDHGAGRLRAGGSGIVACSAGEGIADVFRAAGAIVIASGPRHRASTGQLIEAIREQHRTGVSDVIVLPNDADTELAAAAAVRAVEDEGIEAHLVRARTAVQGVAALAVFEPSQPAATNALAMQAAASATRHGAVTVSNREALTSGGYCVPGDILGIVDGDIVIVGSDQEAVGVEVVRRLLSSGGELLTVVSGADVPDGLVEAISQAAREDSIGLEVTHIAGGQPVYTVLLGVE